MNHNKCASTMNQRVHSMHWLAMSRASWCFVSNVYLLKMLRTAHFQTKNPSSAQFPLSPVFDGWISQKDHTPPCQMCSNNFGLQINSAKGTWARKGKIRVATHAMSITTGHPSAKDQTWLHEWTLPSTMTASSCVPPQSLTLMHGHCCSCKKFSQRNVALQLVHLASQLNGVWWFDQRCCCSRTSYDSFWWRIKKCCPCISCPDPKSRSGQL